MTIKEIQKSTEQKVNELMIPIVKYFEENKNLTYAELYNKWEDYKNQLVVSQYEFIWDTLVKNGVEYPSKFNSDNEIKLLLIIEVPKAFKKIINRYYRSKIKSIIVKNL